LSNDTPGLHRRSIRLREYDYAHGGGYFVTICTHGHKCVFGGISRAEMQLNEVGRIVEDEWRRASEIRTEVLLDAFVVMPNHLHGIVFINEHAKRAGGNVVPRMMRGTGHRSLSALVAGFKAATTRRMNQVLRVPAAPLWQRNYYEHVIRNDEDLGRIRQYVSDNPARWIEDGYHPSRIPSAQDKKGERRSPLQPMTQSPYARPKALRSSCLARWRMAFWRAGRALPARLM
jgi:putative transposase